MKKLTLIVLVMLFAAVSLFASCAKTENSPAVTEATEETSTSNEEEVTEPVTITFLNYSANEGNLEILEEMKTAFEEQNPNITVEIETIGYDDYSTQLQTRIGGGEAPDCFELEYSPFVSYADQGVLLDLSDMITDIDTSIVTESSLEVFSYNDVNYGLPYSYSTCILVYNKDLFDQAELDYPDDSWTWEDVNEAAEVIASLGDDYYGIIQPIQSYEFYKLVEQNGGSLLNEDNTKFTVNSEENVETLEHVVNRMLETNSAPTLEQMGSLDEWGVFELGQTGMIVTGIWCFTTFAEECDFEWDICVEPGNTTKAAHYFANGLCISSDSENAEAAYEWIKFLTTSEEMAMARVEAGWELPSATYADVLALYLETTPPENKQAVFDSLEYVVSQPKIIDFSQMADILTAELEAAAAGVKTPQEALDDAQAELEAVIDLG